MAPNLRILLAEDNPGDVFLVREALKQHCTEFELTVATDGKSAWERIHAAESNPLEAYTLFMLDLNLPVRSGLELLMRIRRSPSAMSKSPVVIVTSSDAERDRTAANRAGANHYFCKPSDFGSFLELGSVVQRLWTAWLRESPETSAFHAKGDL